MEFVFFDELTPQQQEAWLQGDALDMAHRWLRGRRQRELLIKMFYHEKVYGPRGSRWGYSAESRRILAALLRHSLVIKCDSAVPPERPGKQLWRLSDMGRRCAKIMIEEKL
ncbi:hypothetical protein BI081_gp075 [Mycobacterium phage Tonenili]|uniref:Uncharacterized protein n=1 Tax=Mycobacterium phage Tonenili TaxID=1891703 RepID=A0A1C9EH80_9CAUD|nr:hypothetical protein BI081_gp075 [Mycobacterium phage Tonenili]AON96826.1 hypothetical protein SEA_TONENILI_75 [Mycobacterium phage Tonenili]